MTNVEQNTEQPPALEAPPSPLSEETADGVSAVAATGVQAAPVPIVPDDGKPALEFAWNTHRYLNEYIRFADAKAGVVIAVCSALVASLYAGKVYSFLMKTAPAGWGWYGLD
ncbi:MAG: hypothetical protein NT031_13295 [Planctomycetota bacterium]|nr:hypothetical protein [Planctomycetota bacterium]